MTLKYGRGYIDLSTRDNKGRNYILRMLSFIDCIRVAHYDKQLEDDVIHKIQILHSYGVDIHSKDNYGRGCLHMLLDIPRIEGENNVRITMIILSHLIGMGADIHAVDEAGGSVTELAHKNRLGRLWEAALERSGLDVQQVYLDDHHSTLRYSNDIYAPDKDHPRQVRPLNSAYYDLEDMRPSVKDILLYGQLDGSKNAPARVFDLTSTESSEYDGKAPEWSEDSIIEDYNEESHSSSEQHDQISGEDQPDPSTEDEYSDQETGGVPVPV